MFSFAGVKPFDGDGWGTGFTVTVPDGQASGPLFVGLKILPDPDPMLPDSGLPDKSGVPF